MINWSAKVEPISGGWRTIMVADGRPDVAPVVREHADKQPSIDAAKVEADLVAAAVEKTEVFTHTSGV
jgi:hypothetical protein